jgi:hypothetical protein
MTAAAAIEKERVELYVRVIADDEASVVVDAHAAPAN